MALPWIVPLVHERATCESSSGAPEVHAYPIAPPVHAAGAAAQLGPERPDVPASSLVKLPPSALPNPLPVLASSAPIVALPPSSSNPDPLLLPLLLPLPLQPLPEQPELPSALVWEGPPSPPASPPSPGESPR
jgi:hypothetical protein